MSHHWLITPRSGTAFADWHSRGLQWESFKFRFVRYQCAPWLVLAIAPLKLLFASRMERTHEQVRYFSAIAQIDFVKVYELLNDLLW